MTPVLIPCSRNARPQKGLVRRLQLEQHGCSAGMKLRPYNIKGRRKTKAARCAFYPWNACEK